MNQRTIFIYGLLLAALALFAFRVWFVNVPEPISGPSPAKEIPVDADRIVEIPANQPGWRAVGRGPMRISADGLVDLGGFRAFPDDTRRPGDANALVPSLPYGMLVGKVGENGEPFRIGKKAQVAMKETVFLAINDSDYSDNTGSYSVTLTGGTKY
jgi:hypothetical protein